MTPQQGPGREPENGMTPMRRDLREGHQDEPALMHKRMRQDQGTT